MIIAEESLIEPPAWSELDLATGRRRELKRSAVPGYQPSRYLTWRLHATAPTAPRCRSPSPAGPAPRWTAPPRACSTATAPTSRCEFPAFDVSLPSLLDRGIVYAIAHVRGGGECGRNWWLQGRLRAKPNTFDDFIAVASWLAGDAPGSRALVDGSRISARGLSAGGLLQGAVYSRPRAGGAPSWPRCRSWTASTRCSTPASR